MWPRTWSTQWRQQMQFLENDKGTFINDVTPNYCNLISPPPRFTHNIHSLSHLNVRHILITGCRMPTVHVGNVVRIDFFIFEIGFGFIVNVPAYWLNTLFTICIFVMNTVMPTCPHLNPWLLDVIYECPRRNEICVTLKRSSIIHDVYIGKNCVEVLLVRKKLQWAIFFHFVHLCHGKVP